MATRGAEDVRATLEPTTEFNVHVSQRTNCHVKPIDFTEERIRWMYDLEQNQQRRYELTALLVDYKAGFIAVAWRSGEPVFLRVTKDR